MSHFYYLAAEGKVVSEELVKYLPIIQETLEAPDGEVSEEETSEPISQLVH